MKNTLQTSLYAVCRELSYIKTIGCKCDFHLQPIYIYYPVAKTNLFTPDFFRDLFDKSKLCTLFCFGELVAYLAGCKAALGAEAKSVEGNILCGFVDTVDHCLLIFEFRLFRGDKSEGNFFIAVHCL